MSAEIATSPATRLMRFAEVGEGNDKTSVALSVPRNRRLRERSSELLVTNTFTVSRKRTALLARNKKRSSVDRLNPAILFRKITNFVSAFIKFAMRLRPQWPLQQSVARKGCRERMLSPPMLRLHSPKAESAGSAVSEVPPLAFRAPAPPGSVALFLPANRSICCSAMWVLCSS